MLRAMCGHIKKSGAEATLTFEDHARNAALGDLPRSYQRPIEVRRRPPGRDR